MSKKDKNPASTSARAPADKPAQPQSRAPGAEPTPPRWPAIVVWAMMGAFTLVYVIACLVKYRYYLYDDFDMAMDANTAWMVMRGSLYNSVIGVNYLGNHMRLLMLPLAPIYAIAPSCITLIVIQAAGVVLGALPVFWLARRELKRPLVAVGAAALYLLYPANGYVCLYQFHPEALSITTLLFTFWFLWTGRWGWMALFAGISVLAKEDVAVAVLAMGCYAFVIKRPKRWVPAAVLGAIAVASLVLSFGIVMPRLNEGKVGLEKIYAQWGPTTGQAIVGMAKDPVRAAEELFMTHPDYTRARGPQDYPYLDAYAKGDTTLKDQYWLQVLLPVLFLALLSPMTLALALPAVAQHLLSARMTEHTIVYHYTTHVTPFVILAAVMGLRNVSKWMGTEGRARHASPLLTACGIAAAITSNGLFGPLTGAGVLQDYPISEPNRPTPVERAMAPYMDRMVAEVPPNVPAAADFRFLPRLIDRREIHSLHHIFKGTYTLTTEPYPVPSNIQAAAVDTNDARFASFQRPESGRRMQDFLALNRLQCADAAGSALLFLRDVKEPVDVFQRNPPAPKNPRRVEYAGQIALSGYDDVAASVEAGGKLPVRTTWRRTGAEIDRFYLTRFMLVDDLGEEAFDEQAPLGYGIWPAHEWGGDTVRETFYLLVPRSVPPGTYKLCLQLLERGPNGLQAAATPDPDIRRNFWRVTLGSVSVQ